ncbi:MAG: prephenate dehydrogenase [Rothia sp. (in: high G+C Gram-positive bacteria)]|uniref:prephenate dehydrogenase n=1 Tax=Rothia sp. (in: high G+C Gram-positive bacteria) TaxID=1885016 RepID=UPI0026DF0432|nr:prephenate dehydrogenase [Rothia sp. (in: high G+C Gram-positive bacteria)]MDO5751019.1 prephenate dehydrogenase [Rothia sp. (in: high G+C Gram-positive bacteria)]
MTENHDPILSPQLSGPVLIIGTGLLGASIGLGLRAAGLSVYLQDISPTAEAVATDIGAGVPLSAVQARAEAGGEEFTPPSLVIVAAPPDIAGQVVASALNTYPQALVTDVASVKVQVLDQVLASGADARRYVGSHPMAGREKSGPVAARGELFQARPWIICPHEASSPNGVKMIRALAGELGSIITVLDVYEHDQTVALISHVPQAMSSLLASRLQDTPLYALGLAGQGLRDTVRIAASDANLWVQIFAANAQPVVQTLYGVREDLNRLINTLENPTGPGARLDLAQLMSEGNAGVARIPGKHGTSPTAFSRLTVLVDDTPGTLARLLADIGELEVNIEDLRLEHSTGAQVGMAEISVNPSKHDGLVKGLSERGWKVVK